MDQFLHLLLYILAGSFGSFVYHKVSARLEMPYRWRCKYSGCVFSAKASDKDSLEIVKASHTHKEEV